MTSSTLYAKGILSRNLALLFDCC
uniref:Kinase family protein n=1 Tax=Rhizophora mucronata TaxID=61149 RepID=A0A2P2KW09_RHIMU